MLCRTAGPRSGSFGRLNNSRQQVAQGNKIRQSQRDSCPYYRFIVELSLKKWRRSGSFMGESQSCQTTMHMDVKQTITNGFWNTVGIDYTWLRWLARHDFTPELIEGRATAPHFGSPRSSGTGPTLSYANPDVAEFSFGHVSFIDKEPLGRSQIDAQR